MTPNLRSFVDELVKVAQDEPGIGYGKAMGLGGLIGGGLGALGGGIAGMLPRNRKMGGLKGAITGAILGGLGGSSLGAAGVHASRSAQDAGQAARRRILSTAIIPQADGSFIMHHRGESIPLSREVALEHFPELADIHKTAGAQDLLRSLALRAIPGAAVGAGVGGVRGVGDEGAMSGAAKGALVGALLGVPMSHATDRLGAFAGKHLAAHRFAKEVGSKPYHRMNAAQRKAIVAAIGEGARPAQDLVATALKKPGALAAGITGGILGTRDK